MRKIAHWLGQQKSTSPKSRVRSGRRLSQASMGRRLSRVGQSWRSSQAEGRAGLTVNLNQKSTRVILIWR